ncbi:MAG: hypothetical protein KJ621_15170 [Proteobacteria bacterium]|nr:hypothetical protein [Pseudomonadota bacterium]
MPRRRVEGDIREVKEAFERRIHYRRLAVRAESAVKRGNSRIERGAISAVAEDSREAEKKARQLVYEKYGILKREKRLRPWIISGVNLPPDEADENRVPRMPSDVEILALQLKESLERTKDPITAGDFHFSAMEMKLARAMDDKRYFRAFGLWLYRILSGYGERPARAFVWFLLTIFGAALGFALPDFACPWESILKAISHSLPFKMGALDVGQHSLVDRWIIAVETIIGTSLFAIFILALRRRFRR